MLSGRDIVCFANDWASDPTSKKHVMVRLARDNRVLWVDSIGYRAPRASTRDLARIARKARAIWRGCRQVEPNVWVVSPPVLPFHASPLARRVNRRLLAASLRRTAARLGFRDFVTWTFMPTSAGVAGELGESLLVYHCVDETSLFDGVDARSFAALEAELSRRADLVFVSAERLYEAKRGWNPNTFLVRHGVETEHFGRALDAATSVPEELDRLPRPRLGFFGLVAPWVDLDLVAALARARPRWQIVLVGKVETDTAALAGLENVHLFGWRRYEELPAWCRGFDLALLPFRINELTLAANPLKLREYLAAGLPVVSTPLPEAERLGPLVSIGRDADEFVSAIEAHVGSGDTGPSKPRANAMRAESWDQRTAEMSEIAGRFLGLSNSRRAGASVREGGVA